MNQLNQYQYNVQVSVLLLSSLLTFMIGIFVKRKYEDRYSFEAIIFYVFKSYVFLSAFCLFFLSSSFLLKINAGDGIADQLPYWVYPWWYTLAMFSFANILVTICYFYAVESSAGSLDDVLYDNAQAESSNLQILGIMRKRYEIRYSFISLFFSCLTIGIIISILLASVIMCNPGNC